VRKNKKNIKISHQALAVCIGFDHAHSASDHLLGIRELPKPEDPFECRSAETAPLRSE
jgi:hypothetical protein